MFRLVSLNVNGIRSAATKGLEAWTLKAAPDCMGLQELKAQPADLAGRFDPLGGLAGHFHCAEKKGYSGVALYTRHAPSDVRTGLGDAAFDAEGRWVELRFDKPGRRLSLISCYFPSGTTGDVRQQAKYRFLALMTAHLQALRAGREFILVGDVNIAHTERDLRNWRGNRKNSGFLPEERAWMTHTLDTLGLVDVYRHLEPAATDAGYTWWSTRGQAWANNVGWRIDYHLATPGLAATARAATVYKAERFSDHAPLTVDYAFEI